VNPDEAIDRALQDEDYIVQEKIPLNIWAEEIPVLQKDTLVLEKFQTDFRCLTGPKGLFGFLGRIGGVPTNVGSGGGVQPLAVLKSDMTVRDATNRMNDAVMSAGYSVIEEALSIQRNMALDFDFTYLLGPISIALRPRLLTHKQIYALQDYCRHLWSDCLAMERLWLAGELDDIIRIEEEELEIARMNPWKGSPAIIASDGLFGFGAEPI